MLNFRLILVNVNTSFYICVTDEKNDNNHTDSIDDSNLCRFATFTNTLYKHQCRND